MSSGPLSLAAIRNPVIRPAERPSATIATSGAGASPRGASTAWRGTRLIRVTPSSSRTCS